MPGPGTCTTCGVLLALASHGLNMTSSVCQDDTPTIRVLDTAGHPRLDRAGEGPLEMTEGMMLMPGDTLMTGVDSRCAIGWVHPDPLQILQIGGNSLLSLLPPGEADVDTASPASQTDDGLAGSTPLVLQVDRAIFSLHAGRENRQSGVRIQYKGHVLEADNTVMMARLGQEGERDIVMVDSGEVILRIASRRVRIGSDMYRELTDEGISGARGIQEELRASLHERVVLVEIIADEADDDPPPQGEDAPFPRVRLVTSLGDIVIEFDAIRAPVSTENFLTYVRAGFYDGTIFHRVVKGGIHVVQGGGLTLDMERKEALVPPIVNEWRNGLRNERGTISMARTMVPDSATSQFFLNVQHNVSLDIPRPDPETGAAYAVFGRVVEGMAVVDAIYAVETTTRNGRGDVPREPIIMEQAITLPMPSVEDPDE